VSDRTRKNANGQSIAKANLPSKTCPQCGRPFIWRKKWAQTWDAVKFCSERCRRMRNS
jgi:hypothetical protein